jgi:hypothetical protein
LGSRNLSFKSLCTDILDLDHTIRFAVIVSMNSGKILATEKRQGVVSPLTSKESELSVMQALIRMAMMRTFQDRLGKVIYATTIYEKLKVATISVCSNNSSRNNNNNNNGIRPIEEGRREETTGEVNNDALVLMVSFEKEADHDHLITRKILPFLNNIGKGLVMV